MREYRYWSRDELVERVKSLELQIDSGAQSIAHADGGQVTYVTADRARYIVQRLNAAIDERDGIPVPSKVKRVAVSPYGRFFSHRRF